MKTKALTQTELATLAASLPSGTAKERVKLAFEIWMEADPGKANLAFHTDRLAVLESKIDTRMLLTFPLALETIFPECQSATREDEFARFRLWQRKQGIDVPSLEREKQIGVFFSTAIFDEIQEWRLAEKKSKAKKKASNAARTRWENAPEETRTEGKAGGKTQQVKKRTKS